VLTIVKGPRGAGKTAWVVRELLTFRRAPIVTNIKLGRWDEIRVLRLRNPKFGPHDTRHYKRRWVTERVFILKPPKNVTFVSSADMTVPKLIRIAQDLRREHGAGVRIILAVDEAGLKWDSRQRSQTPERSFWRRFYKVSRHFGYEDVYVITQIEAAIEKQIRELADVAVQLLNLKAAFPMVFGWIPWPFGIQKRAFYGIEKLPGIRWPFYMIFPYILNRYDHQQFREEFQAELATFQDEIALAEAKARKKAAALA